MHALIPTRSRRAWATIAALVLALGLALLLAAGKPARAANGVSMTVNTTADAAADLTHCGNPAPTCSLRDAITIANNDTNDVIHLPELPAGSATVYLTTTGVLPAISAPMTIAGDDPRLVAVDGNNANSVFVIGSSGPVTITGITIQNGLASIGGGILSRSTALTLGNDIIQNNVADNQGGGRGGGVYNLEGTLTVLSTTFANNATKQSGAANLGQGGGIYNVAEGAGATLTLVNDTFSGNSSGQGGAIYTDQVTGLNNVTISGNTAVDTPGVAAPASHGGGGIYEAASTRMVTLHNTIVSKDLSGDCAPTARFTSTGHNIDGDNTCALTAAGDKPSTDPLLAALAFNAPPVTPPNGYPNTMAIAQNSPAFNTADGTNCPTADERGTTRPQNGACDIGAFELVVPAPALPKSGVLSSSSEGPQPAWLGLALLLAGALGAVALVSRRA